MRIIVPSRWPCPFVDAEQFLHGARGQAHLVPDDAFARIGAAGDVELLDAVRLRQRETGVGRGERRYRRAAALGGGEPAGTVPDGRILQTGGGCRHGAFLRFLRAPAGALLRRARSVTRRAPSESIRPSKLTH
ncbi:MAG: hypothetical protein U1F35_19385 [Steroidobacteraceae bacterium]